MNPLNTSLKNRIYLIWVIAKTDYLQRYYGTGLGLLWALINPIFRIMVYYFVFAFLIFRNRDPEFILYLFLGISVWSYFAENTNKGLVLLKQKKYLIQNVDLNKIDIFISSALSTSFSFFLNIIVYLAFTLFFDLTYSFNMLGVFLLFTELILIVIGVSMVLSCIYLYLSDFKHIWSMAILLGFWTVPIFWDYNIALNEYEFLHYINPVTGIIINIRYIMLYGKSLDIAILLYDFVYALTLLGIGIFTVKNFSHKSVEIQ